MKKIENYPASHSFRPGLKEKPQKNYDNANKSGRENVTSTSEIHIGGTAEQFTSKTEKCQEKETTSQKSSYHRHEEDKEELKKQINSANSDQKSSKRISKPLKLSSKAIHYKPPTLPLHNLHQDQKRP